MTAINTSRDNEFMLSELRDSVGATGRGFMVIHNEKPRYIDSIKELKDWLKANQLFIFDFENWRGVIHYVHVRSERGGD